MPSYWRLKYEKKTVRNRILSKLRILRNQIHTQMPVQTTNQTLVLGTWNIRNFDDNRFGHGYRLSESFYYIAEIIAAFDIIALQELTRDLRPLDRLMSLLGSNYEYIVTDVTEGASGNTERLGIIYDKRKVSFRGVAGEIVLPDNLLVSDVTKKRQFARTPFACSFQSGWFQFFLATVHIYYGKVSKKSPEYARRVEEIRSVARFLTKRARREEENYLLVGDFNIEDFKSETFDALEKEGFGVFRNKTGSNQKQTHFYDQISFRAREDEVCLAESERAHGVLNIFESIFTEEEAAIYANDMKRAIDARITEAEEKRAKTTSQKVKDSQTKKIRKLKALKGSPAKLKKYFVTDWRTFQVSDHFPLWVELKIDFTEDYFDKMQSGQA